MKYDIVYLVNGERHRTISEFLTIAAALKSLASFKAKGFVAWIERIC